MLYAADIPDLDDHRVACSGGEKEGVGWVGGIVNEEREVDDTTIRVVLEARRARDSERDVREGGRTVQSATFSTKWASTTVYRLCSDGQFRDLEQVAL